MKTLALLVAPVAVWWLGAPQEAPIEPAAKVEIQEWPVPWPDTRPRDPYVDAEGRVWFVGQAGNYIAVLDPTTGAFKRYELDAGTGPHNLIVDTGGMIWYAGNRAAHIGRLDPSTGQITKFPMPDPGVRDPHTLVFDPKGDIWFTAQGSGAVGKLVTATGEVRVVKLPAQRARPYGIAVDAAGRPWFNEVGNNLIGTIDPVTFELKEYAILRAEARSRRIAITSDQAIWYVDYAGGYLGRFDPKTGQFEEWQAPGGAGARPYAMGVDDQDRAWFFETGAIPNRLVGFDYKQKKFISVTAVPSGAGTVRHMYFDRKTRSFWFGTDTNNIARATVGLDARAE